MTLTSKVYMAYPACLNLLKVIRTLKTKRRYSSGITVFKLIRLRDHYRLILVYNNNKNKNKIKIIKNNNKWC